MISIEGNDQAQDRCEFNKPYACIDLKMGQSSTILPNLNINEKDSIVWLDYDGLISDNVFSDINTVVTLMKPDSFFMLSINADVLYLGEKQETDKKEYLKSIIGDERFPNKYNDSVFTKKLYFEILHTCIIQQINQAVKKRNGMEEKKVVFHQTVYFEYRDGARMLTLGGFLFEVENENNDLDKMLIPQLPFYRNGSEPFKIQCPVLSVKEIQALNALLPCKPMNKENKEFDNNDLNAFPINNDDIDNYASLYRYFPNFVETLL